MNPKTQLFGVRLRYWQFALAPAALYWTFGITLALLRSHAPTHAQSIGIFVGGLVMGLSISVVFYCVERRTISRLREAGNATDEADLLKPTQRREFQLPGTPESVFVRLENALIDFGALIERRDSNTGVVIAHTPQSWKSYGESIQCTVALAEDQTCKIVIVSKPKMWLTNWVTNYGRSWENVEALQSLLSTGTLPKAMEEAPEIAPALRNPPPIVFQAGSWQRACFLCATYLLMLPTAARMDKLAITLTAAAIGVAIELIALWYFSKDVRRKTRTAIQEHWEAILMNVWVTLFLFGTLVNPSKSFWDGENLATAFMVVAFGALTAKRFGDRRSELEQRETLRHERERAELERQLAEAKLVALSAQIEPHFLFNTLASIQYLTKRDADKAHAMVSDLIRYLRLALPKMKQATAPLADELELVRAYLGIMCIRMGDRLSFSVQADQSIAQHLIPTMMVITLVENAIKHGLERKPDGGSIEVRGEVQSGAIKITVSDTGGGFSTANSGTGIGLANIRERLATLYSGRASLELAANQPTGVIATVSLPLTITL